MNDQLEQIVDAYSTHLLRIAYFYTKNRHAAEDIVQDVFIKYMQVNYEERGQLKSYLSMLTINKSKDYLKSWAYKKLQFETKWWMKTTDPDHLIQQEERSTIGAAILNLPLKYREPIVLYYFDEMPIIQIAQLLEINENTVKTRLRRAREQLRHVLDSDWEVLNHE